MTIPEREFDRLETDSLEDIVQLLEGRVFHVTKRQYWPAIMRAEAIQPNKDSVLPTTFGYSRNGYFRKRGCVSLFDYRENPTEKIQDFRSRCWPFSPAMPDGEIAILILKAEVERRLVSWQAWKDDKAYSEMVVPHVEAGHPGPIPVSEIEQVIFVRLREDPASLAAALRRARVKAQTERWNNEQ